MSSVLDSSSIDNPKPSAPILPGSKKIAFQISSSEDYTQAVDYNRNINFALEVLKFMPKYKELLAAGGQDQAALNTAYQEYGDLLQNADGTTTPAFGQVEQNNNYYYTGRFTDGLQFTDSAANYDHVDDSVDNGSEQPVVAEIDSSLWTKIKAALPNDQGNFYDLMMKGIDGYSPEQAYYLMVAMLESRTRVANTMEQLFGSENMSAEERVANFDNWLNNSASKIDQEKLGMLSFLLDSRQAFVSQILPFFGGSNQFYQSDLDKANVEKFFEDLSSKVAQYVGAASLTNLSDAEINALPQDKRTAILLWDKWLNPPAMFKPENNVDPAGQDWGKQLEAKVKIYLDKIVQDNVIGNIIHRSRMTVYKQKMDEYEEKDEQNRQDDLQREKISAQNKARLKADEQKSIAKSRAENKNNSVRKPASSSTAAKAPSFRSDTFRAILSQNAGKIRQASNRSVSNFVGKLTPAKTVSVSGNNQVGAARKVAAVYGGNTQLTRSQQNIRASQSRISRSAKATASKTTSAYVKQPETSSEKRISLSKAITASRIKSAAPKAEPRKA